MKKFWKKLSNLTKVILVIGLFISNLSPLSIVFAYEASDLLQLTLNGDKLNIEYLDDLTDDEKVKLQINENYTYLDNSSYYVDDVAMGEGITGKETLIEILNVEEFLTDGYELETILKEIIFDGFYEVVVQMLDESDQVIDMTVYSNDVRHNSGLSVKLYDELGNEIGLHDEMYSVSKDNSKVKVVAKLLTGGLLPNDIYHKDNSLVSEQFSVLDLLDDEFINEYDYNGYLYGEYTQPLGLELYKEVNNGEELELVEFSSLIKISYETEKENDLFLNGILSTNGLADTYMFSNRNLYVMLNDELNNVFDLYNVLEEAYGGNDIVSYVISNGEYEDVVLGYDSELYEGTLEDYLDSIVLDNNTSVTLSNTGLTLNYNVIVVGDINSDNVVDELDLAELMNQVVDGEDINGYNDLNRDEELNILDVMYLDQVIKSGSYDITLNEIDALLESKLVLNANEITSGDEFTVSYVLSVGEYEVSGVSGLLEYDSERLELVSISSPLEWNGSNKNGKFMYLGTDSLVSDKVLSELGEEEILLHDYVVVDVTFRAISSGTTEVSIIDCEYINQNSYLLVDSEIVTLTIVINASDDNSLSNLVVAGNEIELKEEVLDYEITVSNDTLVADVEASVSNVAANITSIVSPEELVEGKNVVTVTVESESGNIKIYTVVVNRESAPKEENTTQINYTSNSNTDNKMDIDEKDDLVVTTPSVDEDDEEDLVEEEDNLSRIIIIILILLVIAGLVYLIFKDEDDEETKKVNKEVNKLKKENVDLSREKEVKKTTSKTTSKNTNSKSTSNKNKKNSSKKTER